MKLLILAILSLSTFASLTPKREALYNCVNYDDSKHVEGVTIYKSRFGRSEPFYEVQVHVFKYGVESHYFKKVNKISKYEDRVQEYTTGNFRVKVDRVRRNQDNHFYTFARIPKHNIHSKDWSCKDSK
jgi:arginine/ornithine N-succinyltransferase beta subunit